jgi:hypothetical protein
MIRKMISLAITYFALTSVFVGTVPAQSASSQSDKVRTLVRDLGTGAKAKIEGKLRNGSKFKGHVTSTAIDSFSIVDNDGHSRTVNYDDVESAKKPRTGLKPRTWVIIGAAAAAAIIVTTTVLYPVLCDGGAGC